jgi:hypothetical protein
MTIYCTYLTVYKGNLLPPFYIGYTNIEKIAIGYNGSVTSKKYRILWEQERKENIHLFKTVIIKTFKTKDLAIEHERYLQTFFNVDKNPMYINQAISNIKFKNIGGYTLSNRTKNKMKKQKSEQHRKKISKSQSGIPCPNRGISRIGVKREGIGGRKRGCSAWNKDISHSDMTIYLIQQKALNRERIQCLHCSIIVTPGNFARWHGDNCKLKPSD